MVVLLRVLEGVDEDGCDMVFDEGAALALAVADRLDRWALRRTRRWCETRGWDTPRNVTSSVTSAGELMRR